MKWENNVKTMENIITWIKYRVEQYNLEGVFQNMKQHKTQVL